MLYLGLNKRYLVQPPASVNNKLSYTLFLVIGHFRDSEIGNSKEGQGQWSWKRWSLDERKKPKYFHICHSLATGRCLQHEPGEFCHVLGHLVNSLNRYLCDKNKVSVFESFHPPKEESERKRLTTFLV